MLVGPGFPLCNCPIVYYSIRTSTSALLPISALISVLLIYLGQPFIDYSSSLTG
jgi:hypothetical protein